jgi:hypothetical protein
MTTYQAERLINELSSIAGNLHSIHQLLCFVLIVLSAQLLLNLFRK